MARAVPGSAAGGVVAADPGRQHTTARAWYALAILLFAAMLSYTDRQILNLLVDPIRSDLAINEFQVSLLQGAAFALVFAIVGLPLGRWADKGNRRNLIIAGVLLWSSATAACGVASTFTELFIARMLVGVGEAALAPAAISLIHDLFPERRRGTALGIFMTGMVVGIGAANIVGGGLLGFYEAAPSMLPIPLDPWRATLITMMVPGFLLAILLLAVREPTRQAARSDRPQPTLREAFAQLEQSRAALTCLIAAIALGTVAEYATGAWLPTLLMRVHHLTPAAAGAYLGATVIIAGGLGTLLGGVISDALQRAGLFQPRILVPAIALFLALPALLSPLASSPNTTIGMFAVYTCLTAMATTGGITAVQDNVPGSLRGLSISVIAFANTAVGLGVGPSLVGFVTAYVFRGEGSLQLAIVAVSLPIALCAVLLFFLARRLSRPRPVAMRHEIAA